MTQEELLERIRKRQEELEKENQVVTFETNEETGETTPSIDFDKMSKQEQLALRVKAIENGYVNEEYKLATEQADRAEKSLLEGASRERLADFYKVYTDETNRAIQNGDSISYYKNEIMRSKIKNMLADQSSPLSALQDTISEVGTGVTGSIADTINLGAMGYITLTDNIDADALYNVAKNTNGNLQDTLDKYSTGKKNYERLEKLKQAYPNDKIVDSVYKHVTDQNFKGDKKYFYDTVGYLNNLLNTSRFEKFERAHTLDETEARENLKLRESMSYGKLGQFALDTVGTISYMAPSIALGMGVNSAVGSGVTAGGKQILSKEAGQEIAKQVGLTTMATSAAGQAANSTLRQGYEWNQALAKGVSDGMLEYLSELIGGEALNKALVGSRSAVTPLGKLIGKGVEKIENKWLKFGASVLGDITAEAWEEMATEAIQPFLDKAILNKDITDWEQYGKDIINAGIQSILPTLILGGMNRVQVSNTIKKQMEAIAFAIETTPSSYLSEEQKNQLRQGVKEAYENATHFLADEQTEEQYNQVVEDTYKALQEAEKKYKSAQELAKLINAGTNLEKAQQRPQIFDEDLQGVRQTQEAEDMVGRLNTAQQSINNSIEEQNLTHNLNQALSQNAFGKATSEANITGNDIDGQSELNIKAGDTYTVDFEGEPATITVRAIRPDEETGEVMALVQTSVKGAEPVVMPLAQLENRIKELQQGTSKSDQRMTNSTYTNKQINTFKGIIKARPYGSIGELTSDIASELAKIDGEMASNVEPYWNEAKRIVEAITNDDLSKIKKPRKSLRKNSVDNNEPQKYTNIKENEEPGGNENGEYNRRKDKNDRRGAKQQNNTSSRNDNKNIRKLGKTNDVSKEKRGEANGRENNGVYKEAYGNIIDKAKKRYGTTNDFKFGAYLLPDGSLLKLERNGRRGGHYMVEELGTTQEEFIDQRAIRLVPENGSVQLSKEPTTKQYAQLENFVEYLRKTMQNEDYEIWVEIKGRSEPFIFDSKKVGRAITQKIREYFEENKQANEELQEIQNNDVDYQRDLFEAILEQLDEAEINEEAIKLWEEETGETWQMDGWDYLQDDDDIMEKAREIVYERFVNSEEGQRFIEEFEEDYGSKDLTFSTDMEISRNSIVERKLKEIEANPSLREEHETTSLTEIRNFINQQLLKGRLGTGQFRHKAYGVYNQLSNWVRLRQGSNVDTLIHELGHYIDDEILKSMYKNNPDMKKELGKLCDMAFPGSYRGKTKLMEGFAEATRYFIIAPEELAKLAPVTAAVITNEFDKSETLKDVYPKLQKMFHDYINMTSQERVHSKVVTGTPKDRPSIGNKAQNALRWIVRQVFNKNEAATFYDKTIEKAWQEKYGKGMPVPTALKLFDNLRRANSSGDSIKQLLTNGVYDPMDGKRVTNGVNRILEPFREEAETKAKELGLTKDQYLNRRINDMIDLGLAERTIELIERSKREGKTYETGIREADAQALIKQFKGDKAVHQVLKDIRKVSNDIIDYAVKKGVLKEESASEIKASNVFYMPLNRIMDEFGSFGASTSEGATRNPFYRLNGSDRDIQNPMESLVGNWARVLKTIDDNFVRQQMVKVGKQVEDFGDFFTEVAPLSKYQGTVSLEVFKKFLEDNLSPNEFANLNLEEAYNLFVPELASKEKMTLSYLENGKRKYIKFANNDYGRPLYEMLTMLNANQVNQVLNAISWFNQGIRLGATSMNPFFALGNTISDEFQAFLYSDGLVIPVAQAIFDIARLWKAKRVLNREDISTSDRELKELYSRYKTSNASLAGKFKLAEKNVKEVTPDIWGVSNKALFGSENKLNKAKDIMSKFGGMLSALPEFSEEMTRFGEFVRVYKQLVREGMPKPQAQLEAGIKAREITQDFSIQGEFMQHLNKIIPFSAAKVGGLYRFGQEFKKHPGRLSMRMGMLIGFAMLVAQLRHGDDDAEEYYEELNNRKKFDNFVFDNPTDGAHPFVVKKPQGVPRYFLGLTEYIFDLATGYIPKGEEEKRFKDWLALSTSDLLPINSPTDMVPGFVQPLLENILNQDFYYGSKIVPTNLEKLDPENQYNEYTSEIGKALGKIFNYSPIKIDNIIEGAFAGMGSFALDTGDYIYDLATGNDTRVRGQDYVKSRLFGDVFRSSESVNMVYEKLEKYENDEAEGRLTEEEAEEYERLKVAKTIFNKISKQMKEIRTDDTMKSDKKEEELNKLYELRTDTARYYLGKELISDNSQSKIEIYRYYPASTTYKYKVGNKTVELSFEDNKIQEEYANMLKTQYERELTKLKRKSEYRRADPAGQAELEKNLLSNTRQKVNETMKERVYRRQRK